jgi:hypothetical protein
MRVLGRASRLAVWRAHILAVPMGKGLDSPQVACWESHLAAHWVAYLDAMKANTTVED